MEGSREISQLRHLEKARTASGGQCERSTVCDDMWVIKFKLSIRILIGGYPQAKMSQGSVDLSSLPCGSSVDGSLRIRGI